MVKLLNVADIVLTTLNAKFIHAAFGLRYLLANLGDLKPRAGLAEFDINQRPLDIAEVLLGQNPRIIGFGVYIWNVEPTTEVITAIKRVRPEIKIILGGPEVSYETEEQKIVQLADHVITGEADLKFAEVCGVLLERRAPSRPDASESSPKLAGTVPGAPLPKIIPAEPPDFSQIALPNDLYSADDLAHRIIYVEASRGCPFTCEFCLSSLDIPVRQAPLDKFLGEMQKLLDRGLKQFKFVDRTFNLNVATSRAILEFFLARYQPGHFFHFEMIPDRLPESLREVIARFPPGALQFEVGIQTFNPEVGGLIKRRQNYEKLADNFLFLRRETGVHIHADLIVGLPGESVESFAAGFDRLIALGPQEIQVGILKRLRGTPIVRHDAEWQMIYSPQPPYEILQNRLIDFATMQRLRRFARYWDLVGNSGNFIETTPLIWSTSSPGLRPPSPPLPMEESDGERRRGTPPSQAADEISNPTSVGQASSRADVASALCADSIEPQARHYNNERLAPPPAFAGFLRISDWLYARARRTDGIALVRLMELLFEFLTKELRLDAKAVAETLWRDYQRGGRHDKPGFLKSFLSEEKVVPLRKTRTALPKRQARHLV